MNDIIRALELCKWAPSGGNTQPWELLVEEMTSESLTVVFSLSKECKERDLIMEAHGAGALYSLGTIVFTAKKIFSDLGWDVRQEQFIDREGAYNCRAILKFVYKRKAGHSLSDIEETLKKRRSNRNLYARTPVDEKTKKILSEISKKYSNLRLSIYEETKNKVAQVLGPLEYIRCQNRQFAEEFISEVHFKPSLTGLLANTLGMPVWILAIMRLWKSIAAMRYQFFIGAQWIFRYLAVDRPIRNSGALFVIEAEQFDYNSIYQVGQCLVESWFLLDEQSYGVQVFGLPGIFMFLKEHPRARQIFSVKEIELINRVHDQAKNLGIDIAKPCLLFRSGVVKEPAPLTPRRPLNISFADGVRKN